MDINITPALQIENKKNLSAEEFQKQLCSWLESRGLLCELRAYFRSNMIEVLKNTALGSTLSCKVKQTVSPKMQAMNLLISEYFIYSQYHFSLCVFCTEVQLHHMLPDVNNTSVITKQDGNFKFSEKEVYDILEGVGLLRHNKQAQKIYTSYCELDSPLITYFLPSNSVTSISANDKIEPVNNNEDMDYEFINCYIDKIITNSNMSPSEIIELKQYIKLLCDKHDKQHSKAIDDLKEQYRNQLKKYKSKLHNIHKSFENERQKFQEDINLMKQELTNVVMQNRFIKENEKSFQIANVSNLLEELQQIEMPTKQDSIVKINVEDKSTQWLDEKPVKKVVTDREQQTITNTCLESAVLKHVVEQLEKENNNLRNDNFNYCQQIDELANRASILMNELNISQQNIVRLNNILQNSPSIFTPHSFSERQQTRHFTGAGEECLGAFKENTRSNFRHLSKRNKQLSSKKLLCSSGTTSGNTSPTDDLLQEARTKLKNLELESEDIDRKMLSFTERFNFVSNQNKHIENKGSPYQFNVQSHELKNTVFEFGTSSVQNKNSHTDTECTSYESRTTFESGSTSCSHFDASQASDED